MNKSILADYLDSLEECGIPACDCMIYHKHKPVFRHITGYADSKKTKLLDATNNYWIFSATKIITCTALMQLVEKGLVGLDDTVGKYLPEYAELKVRTATGVQPAKNAMTIRHLLSMQSGLNYNIEAPSILKVLEDTNKQADTRQIIEALANEPLDFEPGTHFLYSLSHDVLGAVIEVVTGQRFSSYLEDNILKPLGMKNTGFKLTSDRISKMADMYEFNMETKTSKPIPVNNRYLLSENYESGGAGLISTTEDYILILDALANGGVSANGHKLLSADSIEMMRTDQMNDVSRKDFDAFGRAGYSYGLGVRTLIEKEKSGARSPLGEFGWDGAAGAYALIDTENQLAVFYVQHVRNCGIAYHVIHPKLRNLTYELLGL